MSDSYDNEFSVYDGLSLVDLVKKMRAGEVVKEEQEAKLKEINKHLDYLRLVKIPSKMEEEGVENMKVEGIGRVQLASDMYVGIQSGRQEEAYQWLSDTGRGDLIKNAVNPSTLKAALKDAIRKGEEVPEEIFRVSPFTRASIVKKV